jgi:hypothetical protein
MLRHKRVTRRMTRPIVLERCGDAQAQVGVVVSPYGNVSFEADFVLPGRPRSEPRREQASSLPEVPSGFWLMIRGAVVISETTKRQKGTSGSARLPLPSAPQADPLPLPSPFGVAVGCWTQWWSHAFCLARHGFFRLLGGAWNKDPRSFGYPANAQRSRRQGGSEFSWRSTRKFPACRLGNYLNQLPLLLSPWCRVCPIRSRGPRIHKNQITAPRVPLHAPEAEAGVDVDVGPGGALDLGAGGAVPPAPGAPEAIGVDPQADASDAGGAVPPVEDAQAEQQDVVSESREAQFSASCDDASAQTTATRRLRRSEDAGSLR